MPTYSVLRRSFQDVTRAYFRECLYTEA